MAVSLLRPLVFALALAAPSAVLAAPSCLDRSNDYAARILLCDQAYASAMNPDDAAFALGYKAEAQRMLRQFDEASATLRSAIRLAPQNPWYWIELGNVRFDEGDPAGALAHYSTAIELDPADGYARISRADAWWQLNAPDRCLADSNKVLDAAPGDALASLIQGRCLTGLGRAEEALSPLELALKSDPAWAPPHIAKVSALLALGRGEEALAAADAGLIQLKPEDGFGFEGLQMLRLQAFARSQPVEAALAEAAALAAQYPENLTIPAVKLWALTRAGRLDEAQSAATPLRKAEAEGQLMQGIYHDALGQLDLARSDIASAARHFTLAMALDPALQRIYTRRLSELGFLPLTSSRHNVALAMQRCIEAKAKDCRIGG